MMRIWAIGSVVFFSSCLQAVVDDSLDASTRPDASMNVRVPQDPPGRCDWDGGGLGLCEAVTAIVFDGERCRPVCTPRQAGEPGFFVNDLECELFCLPPDSGM